MDNGFEAGVVILLGAKDINIYVKDVQGRTALELAKLGESEEIVRLLCAAQARDPPPDEMVPISIQ